jgi:DDE superfamily endonuclease/Helix-turn-helix of DDE superfamily endonuclease
MILRYAYLSRYPRVFVTMTGLRPAEFAELAHAVLPAYAAAEYARRSRPGRQRGVFFLHPYALSPRDQLLLTVVWLRQYPTQEALGYFFGVSDSAARSAIERVLPLLEAAGRDTMRLPDPGRTRRRHADALLGDIPELAVLVDSFEQRCQRPGDRQEADGYYSGKKKTHTLKSQVAVRADDGRSVDVGPSVPGPTADLTLLEQSGLCGRLPPDCGLGGDLGYVGIARLHAGGATPRRKPRGKDRPPADVAYNHAFARERVIVEHSIRRLRRFEALSQTDRHRRVGHRARVRAVAGLVNRHIARQQRRRAA